MSSADTGLSPRVRGSPGIERADHLGAGSIPACAGEPVFKCCPVPRFRVYPRVCGGARGSDDRPIALTGLSPRVRGSLVLSVDRQRNQGSIPACAGEPSRKRTGISWHRVYPRVCGGALTQTDRHFLAPGLSPRVRGSHRHNTRRVALSGSIPACAGEPSSQYPASCLERVYPRVCGGA